MNNTFTCLNLTGCVNNCGATTADRCADGELTLSGSSFPEPELPFGAPFWHNGVPFYFAKHHKWDNMALEGQVIEFPRVRVKQIHVLGTSSAGNMSEYVEILRGEQLLSQEKLYLSHMYGVSPFTRNEVAIQTTCLHAKSGPFHQMSPYLWYDVIRLTEPIEADRLRFDDNPCMHVFGITIEGEAV